MNKVIKKWCVIPVIRNTALLFLVLCVVSVAAMSNDSKNKWWQSVQKRASTKHRDLSHAMKERLYRLLLCAKRLTQINLPALVQDSILQQIDNYIEPMDERVFQRYMEPIHIIDRAKNVQSAASIFVMQDIDNALFIYRCGDNNEFKQVGQSIPSVDSFKLFDHYLALKPIAAQSGNNELAVYTIGLDAYQKIGEYQHVALCGFDELQERLYTFNISFELQSYNLIADALHREKVVCQKTDEDLSDITDVDYAYYIKKGKSVSVIHVLDMRSGYGSFYIHHNDTDEIMDRYVATLDANDRSAVCSITTYNRLKWKFGKFKKVNTPYTFFISNDQLFICNNHMHLLRKSVQELKNIANTYAQKD